HRRTHLHHEPALRQLDGGGQSDHAGADHDDVRTTRGHQGSALRDESTASDRNVLNTRRRWGHTVQPVTYLSMPCGEAKHEGRWPWPDHTKGPACRGCRPG